MKPDLGCHLIKISLDKAPQSKAEAKVAAGDGPKRGVRASRTEWFKSRE